MILSSTVTDADTHLTLYSRAHRQDEYEVAWQLYNMASTAAHTCVENFHVDGIEKKVNQVRLNGSVASAQIVIAAHL